MLLITLLASYLLSAFLQVPWIGTVELGLFTVAGLLALRNYPVRSRAGRIGISAALVTSVALIVISATVPTDAGRALTFIWTATLLLLTVLVLIRQILLMPNDRGDDRPDLPRDPGCQARRGVQAVVPALAAGRRR